MLALRDLIRGGTLGTLVDIDVRIVIDQPWHNWTFLEGAPRLEVPYHSIHYSTPFARWPASRRACTAGPFCIRSCRGCATRAARSSWITAIASAARSS